MKTKQQLSQEIRKEEVRYDKMAPHHMQQTTAMKESLKKQEELYKEYSEAKN